MAAILTLASSQPSPQSGPANTDLLAEANHRIANSLSLLAGMVRMQTTLVKKRTEPYSSAEVRHLLDGVTARITAVGQLHRSLSQTCCDGIISLKPHLHDIADALVSALSTSDQKVRVTHTGGDCMVLMRQVQPITLILCEIFINSMKYAHPSGVPLAMTVDCNVSGDGRLVLTISDDGVGLPEGFELGNRHGMGFRVMHSLAAEIGGELQVQSGQLGVSFRLSLPASAMAGVKLA
ncbi:MAG: sensor histidine kinase [Rhizomicrobium sp.]